MLFFFIWVSFLLLSPKLFAQLRYRSGADILPKDSMAIDLQGQFFSKTSAYDETGSELISSDGTSFTTNDWTLKYTKGYLPHFEGTFILNYRSVNSQTTTATTTNSGIESIGLQGKYLFFSNNKFSHALGLHSKKALFSNERYELPNTPPTDRIVLGDDGLEYGIDYYLTYTDKYFNYDFKFGYNKPSADLSSELIYNTELLYKKESLFFLAGIGGTLSQKNDKFTEDPSLKPAISTGESRSFNSINAEKSYLYAGIQYVLGDFIIGLKGETIYSGRSIDKGNTISFNLRWEKIVAPSKTIKYPKKSEDSQKYFAQGFVGQISRSGKMLKINIGTNDQIIAGTNIDVFSIDNYISGTPIATGVVIKTGTNWSIVKLNIRQKKSTIQLGSLVKAY